MSNSPQPSIVLTKSFILWIQYFLSIYCCFLFISLDNKRKVNLFFCVLMSHLFFFSFCHNWIPLCLTLQFIFGNNLEGRPWHTLFLMHCRAEASENFCLFLNPLLIPLLSPVPSSLS